MLVSCIQMNPQNEINHNMNLALKYIFEAAKKGSEIVVLPEMFSYMGEESKRYLTKNNLGEGLFKELQQAAKENNIHIVCGSHSEEIKNIPNKVFNTCVTYNNNGDLISIYRKLHLFNLKDKFGNPLYCESDMYENGKAPEGYQIQTKNENWSVLNMICYDLRFPEIIRNHVQMNTNPFDIIFVPAAFTWQTGKDHWEILLRARAIENQCYVVACNQTGFFSNGQKRNYGNSMIIDPWGQIVAKMDEEVGILTADINKEKIKDSRTRLPALADRKIF